MLTLAIDRDEQRVPTWDKQADRIFQLPPANTNSETHLNLLTETLEPMITGNWFIVDSWAKTVAMMPD